MHRQLIPADSIFTTSRRKIEGYYRASIVR
jgi:hypothetical protein